MSKYLKKQIIIALIYLIIFWIIAGAIYLIFIKPALPTCYDGIQNQNELGVDCGGPCTRCPWEQGDLKIISAEAIKTQDNYVDLVAKIKNPNSVWGAKSLSYTFDLYDYNNNLMDSLEGSFYILPQETRYIIKQRILASQEISYVKFKISNIDWQKLIDYEEPDLLIRNSEFKLTETGAQIIGDTENKSNYDFAKIDIYAVLFDKDSKILAVGQTDVRAVLSRENRYFEISWFYPIFDSVDKFEVVAKTNLFLDENFMKRHGGREKFQEY